MAALLKSTDSWFLVFLVLILGGYFIWSVQSGISDIKNMIRELFEDRNAHDERIKELEVRCGIFHGPIEKSKTLYQKGERNERH